MAEIAPTLEILDTLIAFDTTSRNSNLALIEWVEDFLRKRNIAATRVASADGAKANLYAVIGPAVPGGVVLSGHTDVVPVDGQAWTSDPWALTKSGEKFYGRGVADMKTFSALALAHVDEALGAGLKRPLILALSYDEEVGCLGAPAMIAEIARAAPRPSAVIVGEPTSMQVVSGHKGISVFHVAVEGREAHSSATGQGVSAIMEALKLMNVVEQMGADAALRADPQSPFEPKAATMTIGMVDGGTASNILARRCAFVWDLRCPPGDDPEAYVSQFMTVARAVDAQIKLRAPEGGVTVTRRSNTPPLSPRAAGEAETLARALTGDNGLHVASYAAEAGLFQQADFSVVLCGPGSIAQAHQPDEWIEESQIAAGAAFMKGLIRKLGE
jgi:acetylornithine deacetylase